MLVTVSAVLAFGISCNQKAKNSVKELPKPLVKEYKEQKKEATENIKRQKEEIPEDYEKLKDSLK